MCWRRIGSIRSGSWWARGHTSEITLCPSMHVCGKIRYLFLRFDFLQCRYDARVPGRRRRWRAFGDLTISLLGEHRIRAMHASLRSSPSTCRIDAVTGISNTRAHWQNFPKQRPSRAVINVWSQINHGLRSRHFRIRRLCPLRSRRPLRSGTRICILVRPPPSGVMSRIGGGPRRF